MPMVMITDYALIIENFQKQGDVFAGRLYTDSFMKIMREGNYGVIHMDGDIWREHRRFALQVLRDFGLGKNVLGEVSEFIKKVKNDVKNGITEHDLADQFQISVGSVINAVLFGYRFEGEKLQEYNEIKKYVDDMIKVLANPVSLIMWKNTELFKYVPLFRGYYYRIIENRKRLFNFFDHQIKEHVNELNFDSAPTDYVDAYLREQAKRDKECVPHTFHITQLYNMCFDLWIAGQETTSSTLSWGMAYLMLNPDMQEKLHQELSRVIGSDRLVTLNDKKNLPYTNAVINVSRL
uniref:Cytochrome P450 n=1 Tax=Acrobeloides nanus TaxID=290746 RepID=A0A914ED72_9BILA